MIRNKTVLTLGAILFLGGGCSAFAGDEDAATRCRSQLDWSQSNYETIVSGCQEWIASGNYPARAHYYLGRTLSHGCLQRILLQRVKAWLSPE